MELSDHSAPQVVGLISDTHGVLDMATIDALRKATGTIIHAGDVGDARRKARLSAQQLIDRAARETRNTVVAVLGNVDEGFADLPSWQVVTIAGKRILITHICGFPPDVSYQAQELIDTVAPDIVVFGHSHVPGSLWHEHILFINPGSAGPRRFKLPRCVAFLSIHTSGMIEVEFTPVATLSQDMARLPPSLKQETQLSCMNIRPLHHGCVEHNVVVSSSKRQKRQKRGLN